MKLALFDLDNTLLPMDSDHGWSQFLIELGVLDRGEFEARNNQFYADYKAGCLDIDAFLEFQLRPLKMHTRQQLDAWHSRYMAEVIQPNIKPAAVALVKKHQAEGALCMIITATNSFITRPIADAFGIEHLIATEPEVKDGQFTGGVSGLPSFREGKVTRLNDWLNARDMDWRSFETSHFYSDSINDLPLLECVSHPVAANPDPTLAGIARERQWPILELFQ
ncbi:MAG TPA: HAD family hydrolase [Limnobacter sp.]|uniref:histidinol-phosphatase n=1 Tax=Limnobacter sp. TaxID=2003368 RepID=UPI002EDAF684